jgi:pSer/pThr/pTyr-binding forkhead associated (FHA) protein
MPWARHAQKTEQAPAYLVRLNTAGEPLGGNPIALNRKEVTFGADPVQAIIILDDESVSPLHARLRQDDTGNFILADQGSIAGTWLNYEPLDNKGRFLKHGDIIHFGQFVYRFVLNPAPETPPPSITPEASE